MYQKTTCHGRNKFGIISLYLLVYLYIYEQIIIYYTGCVEQCFCSQYCNISIVFERITKKNMKAQPA